MHHEGHLDLIVFHYLFNFELPYHVGILRHFDENRRYIEQVRDDRVSHIRLFAFMVVEEAFKLGGRDLIRHLA